MYKHSLLLDEATIQERVSALASQISADYSGRTIDIVCLLKGAVYFLADLTRQISTPLQLHFIQVSSYNEKTSSSGTVTLHYSSYMNLEQRDVLLIEDILDTGITLDYALRHLREQQPASLKVCVLLDKQERRIVDIQPDYRGFQIPNRFVIGYGLDFQEFGRNLPYVAVLDEVEK